jgi:hypothetical protein
MVEADPVVRLHPVRETLVELAEATPVAAVVVLVLREATALGITVEPVETEPLRPLQEVRWLALEVAVVRDQAATAQAAQVAVVLEQRLERPHREPRTPEAVGAARELERAVLAAAVSWSCEWGQPKWVFNGYRKRRWTLAWIFLRRVVSLRSAVALTRRIRLVIFSMVSTRLLLLGLWLSRLAVSLMFSSLAAVVLAGQVSFTVLAVVEPVVSLRSAHTLLNRDQSQ